MSCNHLRIIVDNYLETATMAISPAVQATMPVENLLIPEREDVLMTQVRSEHVIAGNLDRRRVVSAFALANHTLSIFGTIRLELFADFDQTTLVYDSGAVRARRLIPLQQLRIGIDPWGASYGTDLASVSPLWFDAVYAKSYRITVYDKYDENLDDYWQAGYMVLGRYWSPADYNFSWNPTIQWIQAVQNSRSEGKTLHSEGTTDKYRRVKFQLDWLSEEDANFLYEFIRQYGGLKEFFISMYPEYEYTRREIEHNFIGRFAGELPERTHTQTSTYSVPAEVEEI